MTTVQSSPHTHETSSGEYADDAVERESGEDIVRRSLEDIQHVEDAVTESLDLVPGSAEAINATDEALVHIAESTISSSESTTAEVMDVVEDIAVESAMEIEHGLDAAQTPANVLKLDGFEGSLDEVIASLDASHATLPSGHEVAPFVVQALSELPQFDDHEETTDEIEYVEASSERNEVVEYTQHWEYSPDEGLVTTPIGAHILAESARELLQSRTYSDDAEIADVVAASLSKRQGEYETAKQGVQQEIDRMNTIREGMAENARAGIDAALRQMTERRDKASDESMWLQDAALIYEVRDVLQRREREAIEQAVDTRIQQDKLPWTMPDIAVPQEQMDWFKAGYEGIIQQETEPLPEDVFTIAVPMTGAYATEDLSLLEQAGLDPSQLRKIERQDLQKAGVFFVNRIGDGEQPILGMAIPDAESPDGMFDAGSRSILTKAEFEKVYDYQQAHGYGIGDTDPADVQMDMVAFGMRFEDRARGVIKSVTPGSRINKYNQVLSPFVDSGHRIKNSGGLEGYVIDQEQKLWAGKGKLRMNDITVHLVNAHPEYPGLSEMFEETAAHDQKYMSAGDFMDIYQPPPTPEEAFISVKSGFGTRREQAWVGALHQDRI